jgi:hypothetical protein
MILLQTLLTYLKSVFYYQWKRKLFACFLSIFFWFIVNHSLSTTRTLLNVPIRVVNLSPFVTIDGIETGGKLAKKINLTLVGNKKIIDSLQSSDLEIVLDATGHHNEWPILITKKNLATPYSDLDLNTGISKVVHQPFSLHLSKLVTEKITIQITNPIGEAPRGYQFLDVWPYKLELTVTGPEEVLKKTEQTDLKLTFNLSEVTKTQLDLMSQEPERGTCDVVCFPIPETWKVIRIPSLSNVPLMINDPKAKLLRFDFIRYEFLPIENKIPIYFFYHPSFLSTCNPENITIDVHQPVCYTKGVYYLDLPLYVSGVDKTFLDLVKDHIQIVVDVNAHMKQKLNWSIQIISAQRLENEYVEHFLTRFDHEDLKPVHSNLREEYFRNRFRSYMQRLRIFNTYGAKLSINFSMENFKIKTSVQQVIHKKNEF